MNLSLPDIELLEKTHQFPCPYMFKIIGKSDQGFQARVVAAVREVLMLDVDPDHSVRSAVGGRHLSVTVETTVQTPQQVIDVYRRLGAMDGVVMLF